MKDSEQFYTFNPFVWFCWVTLSLTQPTVERFLEGWIFDFFRVGVSTLFEECAILEGGRFTSRAMKRLAIVGLAVLLGMMGGEVGSPVRGEMVLLAQGEAAEKVEADWLFHRGILEYDGGQFREALQSWERALEIYGRIGDRGGVADSLNGLGGVYRSLGEYQQAIAFYEQSLEIQRQIGDRQGEAGSLMGLGNVYNSLGE
ncbi:tetratricopeptide repeat protein [Spirulina sp. CS-785/01]|uniref:tetratricopeptide repeat protein n=1 Tax=Spirulina sp. CS-785/01 TaxID=3021716 RepID=UPI00232CE01C|nr:tetratricopeptide repeat protein [Spirulina sp. CS-785/01]MDB9312876.1 tetratricopeptide repeat protein [Spirulina sp. CS-785/01]